MSHAPGQKDSQRAVTVLEHNSKLDIYSPPMYGGADCTWSGRLTRIVCTIGPKTKSVEKLTELRKAGMNVVRMNFSHGSYEYHGEVIANTRKSYETEPLHGREPAIALDTKGPEIRTGQLKGDSDVKLEKGAKVTITTDEAHKDQCSAELIYMDYKNLTKVVKVGGAIFIDDGLISVKVLSVEGTDVQCEVMNSGMLGGRKGVNLPEVDVDLPALSEKDQADLKWGVSQGIDMVFASFIRKASDVEEVRACLGEEGEGIKIISKIENHEGMRNFDEILAVTDGVMVARGDLGIEIPAEKVFLAQKMMIAKCNIAGKPIICATQMLESMTFNPRPTRAEVSDVANAVLDGADCVMLSGETAKGSYPIEAVTMMANICKEAESAVCYKQLHTELASVQKLGLETTAEAVAQAAVQASVSKGCSLIMVLSTTGQSARLLAQYRPLVPIVMITRNARVAHNGHLHRGCYPYIFKMPMDAAGSWEEDVAMRLAWGSTIVKRQGMANPGEYMVVVQGWKSGGHSTNTMRIVQIT